MKDKVTGELKKLTRRVDAFTALVKACGRCVKEIVAVLLSIYGLVQFVLRHWPR